MEHFQTEVFLLADESETAKFAARFGKGLCQIDQPMKIYLYGNLGAGKTTFSRYLIQSVGIEGPVKSPTYTLIEPYEMSVDVMKDESEEQVRRQLLHMDLYRLGSPLELYDLGFLEEENAIWLIEWPEKGEGVLPSADLNCHLKRQGESLEIKIKPNSEIGLEMVYLLQQED